MSVDDLLLERLAARGGTAVDANSVPDYGHTFVLFESGPEIYGAYTGSDGESVWFNQWFEGPRAWAEMLTANSPVDWVKLGSLVVKHLDDERFAGFEHDVTCSLVEFAGRLAGGDADGEHSVVLCRPGVAESFDFQSDAFTPMIFGHDDPFDENYVFANKLGRLYRAEYAEGDVLDLIGYGYCWSDERRSYEAVLSPRAYKCRPERAIVVDDAMWHGLHVDRLDFPDEETPDFLCLHVSFRRTHNEPGTHVLPLTGVVGHDDCLSAYSAVGGREVTA